MEDYKNTLLTSEDYIKSQTPLDENISGKVLLPAIKLAQDIELTECLGSKLVDALKSKVYESEIDDDSNIWYLELLDTYVQPFLAYQALANCVSLTRLKVANVGVVNTTDTNVNNEGKSGADLLKEDYLHFAHHYLAMMQKWIKANAAHFPELDECHSCDDSGMASHLNSAAGSSMWLGGARGRIIKEPEC